MSKNTKSSKIPSRGTQLVHEGQKNSNRKLYALAVENYFKSVPDKNVRFRAYTKKEERDVIEKYKNDRAALENDLTEHNIFFALNYASQQAYRFKDYDELISLAMNGLRMAATTFDTTKKYRFNTWVAFYLKKFILKKFFVKKEYMIDNNIAIYLDAKMPALSDDKRGEYIYSTMKSNIIPEEEEKFSKTFVDDAEDKEREDNYKTYANKIIESVATSSLTSLEKTVFSKSFIDGLSVHKISQELEVPRKVVTESKKKVLSYITTNFSKEEIFG